MGTNYYIINRDDAEKPRDITELTPRIHIGKRSGIGDGRCKFIWDIDPMDFFKIYHAHKILFIEDEYRARYHPDEWIPLILEDCDEADYDHIGCDFS